MLHARRSAFVLLIMMATVGVGACSADAADAGVGEAGRSGSPATVMIQAFSFAPHQLDIALGTKVMWTNEDAITHTVTSGVPGRQGVPGVSKDRPAEPDGIFDFQLDGAGAMASFTFEDAGSFRYYCAIHAGMSGEIRVA